MKIMTISDIHGDSQQAKLALEIFDKLNCDKLLILGDILYHGPRNPLPSHYDPKTVIELLNNYQDKIIALRGNCDSEVDQMVLNFEIMADYQTFKLGKRNVFATHGHLYSPTDLSNLKKGDIFIFGHVHLPICIKQNDIYVLNPSSITFPKENNPKTFGILTENNFVIYDFELNMIKSLDF